VARTFGTLGRSASYQRIRSTSRRLNGLSVAVRGAPGVRHDPDRVAAEDPPSGRSLLREGDHAKARLQTMPAVRYCARSIVTLKSSLCHLAVELADAHDAVEERGVAVVVEDQVAVWAQ
jgi:hypothetical protein